ncbi:hypothetical protein Tco_1411715 [Tanacetum coccineum]
MTQVACSKKFVVGKFLNFKMNDAKPVVKKVEELSIKWNFEQLVLKIRVEKDNRMNEKANANSVETNANMVGKALPNQSPTTKNGTNGGGFRQKYSKEGKKDYIPPKEQRIQERLSDVL